jgi:dihydroflavonol-4-reductase
MNQQTAFVTGATGLLGNNLVRLLLDRGFRVRALARSQAKAARQFKGLSLEVVEGDMSNVAAFAPSLKSADIVFHTAAHFRDSYKGGKHWSELYRINVRGTADLISEAYSAGIRRFVHTSSIAVLDGPVGAPIDETMVRDENNADDYYKSKILADREVLSFLDSHPAMWAAMVLPGWMHGPGDVGPTSAGQTTLDFVKGNLPGVIPASFSLVDARDVAAALLLVAEKGRRGERYLAAGRNHTMEDLFRLLEKVSGVKAPSRQIPVMALYLLAAVQESWARLTKKPVLLSWAGVRLLTRETGRTQFDHGKSQRELGLRFRPAEETLRDEIGWYRDNGWLLQAPSRRQAATVPGVIA